MPLHFFKSKACTCLFVVVAQAGFAFPALSQAQETTQKVFEFNISPSGYPPYLIVDNDEPEGIMWDVVALIVPRLGYDVQPRQIPRKRVDNLLAKGYLDGTPRAIEWTREPENFLFTDPIVHVEEVFFFPETSDLEFRRIEDLVDKTIVTPLGYIYPALEPYFDSGKIHRFEVSNERNMFRHLLHSEAFDAALADRLAGRWLLREEAMADHFRYSKKSISRYGFRLMLRPDWQAFAKAFNQELVKIRENGELDAILARYR